MFRIAIVEDDEKEYKILNEYLKRYAAEKGEVFEIEYFPDAVNFISDYHYNYDLIFMDIMMPDLDGMKAAERLRRVDKIVALIFVTSMAQYAIQGYNVAAKYFLVKPILYPDFALKLERTLTNIITEQNNEYLVLDMPGEKRKIFSKYIKYIEVFAHDVVFHMFDEEIHVRGTLSEFEKKLKSKKFCRINSCYLINLDYVSVVKDRTVFIGEDELKISYTRKKTLMKAFADYASDSL